MKKQVKSILALLLAAMLLFAAGCASSDGANAGDSSKNEQTAQTASAEKNLTVTVINGDKKTEHKITTKCETLADALLESKIASGEIGQYGLAIDTVDGYNADFTKGGEWWCLADGNGVMLTVGASDVQLKDGDSYQLILTK